MLNEFLTATLRLAPLLPTTVAVVQFPDVRRATEAVRDVMTKGVGIRKYPRRSVSNSQLD